MIGSLIVAMAIVLLAAAQPTPARRAVALSYAAVNVCYFVGVSWWLDGHGYFISAAAADVLIMWLVLKQPRLSAIGVPLLRVCMAEFVIHAIWWALWWHGDGYDPAAYNAVYQCLQMWLMWILIKKDPANEWRRYKMDHGRDIVRAVVGARPSHISGRGPTPWN